MPARVAGFFYAYAVVRMYYCPGRHRPVGKVAHCTPTGARPVPYTKSINQRETPMTYTHELLQTLTARELSLIADLEAELGEKLTEAEILDGFFKDGQRRQYRV